MLIPLTQDMFAFVDDAGYERLSAYKWFAEKNRDRTFYARRVAGGKRVHMHREVLPPPSGMFTDHIDGNGLNNQRSNLRVATLAQNNANRRKLRGASRHLGVSPTKRGKWRMQIRTPYGRITEYHNTEDAAALSYNVFASKVHGEFAKLNQITNH